MIGRGIPTSPSRLEAAIDRQERFSLGEETGNYSSPIVFSFYFGENRLLSPADE
jgi:hypothetical protein